MELAIDGRSYDLEVIRNVTLSLKRLAWQWFPVKTTRQQWIWPAFASTRLVISRPNLTNCGWLTTIRLARISSGC